MSDSFHRRKLTSSDLSRGRSSRTTRRKVKHQVSRRNPSKICSKSSKILSRSFSEPNLHQSIAVEDDGDRLPEEIVYLSKIRSEVFASAPSLSGFSSPSSSPINQQVILLIIIRWNFLSSPPCLKVFAVRAKYFICYKLTHRSQLFRDCLIVKPILLIIFKISYKIPFDSTKRF